MRNQSTCPGEGFNQEAREDYKLTNGKNIDPQMTRHDDHQEIVARIATTIQASAEHAEPHDNREASDGPSQERNYGQNHWSLGASTKRWHPASSIERENESDYMYHGFESQLRNFISAHVAPIRGEVALKVMQHHCLYIKYASLEDWRTHEDILRSNPNFHGHARYDCALVNVDSLELTFSRLHGLFSCKLENGEICDFALVQMFSKTKSRLATSWTNCLLREELKEPQFVLLKYLIRGALMQEIKGAGKKGVNLFALIDTIDGDWFLRAGN